MKQYTITLTEEQLQLLSRTTDFAARFITGQIGMNNWPYEAMRQVNAAGNLEAVRTEEAQERVKELLTELREEWWNQHNGEHKGVGFSGESDCLWDMQEVMRHALRKGVGDEITGAFVNDYPAHHWNRQVPLIKVEPVAQIGLDDDDDSTTTLEPSAGKLGNPDGIPF